MMLRQLVLVLLASMGAVGMACYSTAFSRVDGMSASSERLGTASVGAMSAGLLLAYGAVLMIARMRGAKGCVALALLSILSAVSIIPVGGPPLLTLESPGVQWLLVLIAGIVLQLCQRLYEPVVIAKGVSEEDKKAGGIRVR